MNSSNDSPTRLRFGVFELDLEAGELRNQAGTPIKLQPQPFKVLALLVGRAGEVVTREDIRREVWRQEVHVDFEHGVNFCIRRIRAALGDDAEAPRYVETLPRKGYRFIARIEHVGETVSAAAPTVRPVEPVAVRHGRSVAFVFGCVAVGVVLCGVVIGVSFPKTPAVPSGTPRPRSIAGTPNPEAYDAYLKAKYLWNKGRGENLKKSVDYFRAAVEKAPSFAPAHAGLADALHLSALSSSLPPSEAYPRAKEAALAALRLDDSSDEAHAVLGSILLRYEWNFEASEREFRRALELNPNSATARHDLAWMLVAAGRFDEGIAEIKRAQALDPQSARTNVDVGWVYLRSRRYADAVFHLKRILELEPDSVGAAHCLEVAYGHQGRFDLAFAEARKELARSAVLPTDLAKLESMDPAEALRVLARRKLARYQGEAEKRHVPKTVFAGLHAFLGENDEAFKALEQAVVERDAMVFLVNVDPSYDALRADPRFADLVRRMGLSK